MSEPTPSPESSSPPAAGERRSAPRTACVVEIAFTEKGSVFRRGTLLDVSATGARLALDETPGVGERLLLTFLTSAGMLFRIGAHVVRVEMHEDGWVVGC